MKKMSKFLKVVYDKTKGELKFDQRGLYETILGCSTIISSSNQPHSVNDSIVRLAKYNKGIVIQKSDQGISIYSDPFCTLPLFYQDSRDKLIASTDPQDLIDYNSHPFDKTGVWETLLFNSPLWNRTPYRNIKFLPSACELKVAKSVLLQRYWNLNFELNGTSFSEKYFFRELDEIILDRFSKLSGENICMGLSGGIDSRLAAYYLSRLKDRFKTIELFTYATNSNSFEFQYACEVASLLGFKKPKLHLLKGDHYIAGLDYLPRWTAGQINNQHCHISSYLENFSNSVNWQHVSNYFTDALFGWECSDRQSLSSFKSVKIYRQIIEEPHISDDVRSEMIEDCELALTAASKSQNHVSSLEEYKYIMERHPRFHHSLAFVQSQYMSTVLPFADFEVLSKAMEVPIELRKGKRILNNFLNFLKPELMKIKNSGSHEFFHGLNSRLKSGSLTDRYEFKKFRLYNLIGQVTAKLSSGDVQFKNPFQTEDQVSMYRKNFASFNSDVIQNEALIDCIGYDAMNSIFQEQTILRNLHQRFHLISFHQLQHANNFNG